MSSPLLNRSACLLALLLALAGAAPAPADEIFRIDGAIAGFTAEVGVNGGPGAVGNTLTFKDFLGVEITQHNGLLLPRGSIPVSLSNVTFQILTDTELFPGVHSYTLGQMDFLMEAANPLTGGTAMFMTDRLTELIVVDLGSSSGLTLAGPYPNQVLQINTTRFDYSPYFGGGQAIFTLNVAGGPAGGAVNDILINGGLFTGTASFSQIAGGPPSGVPEPATWLLLGIALVMVAAFHLLRWRSWRSSSSIPGG
jgi:hypothetical protein